MYFYLWAALISLLELSTNQVNMIIDHIDHPILDIFHVMDTPIYTPGVLIMLQRKTVS